MTGLRPTTERDRSQAGGTTGPCAGTRGEASATRPPGARQHGAALAPAALDVHLDCARRRITARGELDFATSGVLADAMAALIHLGHGEVSVDIGGVTFIDAGGLGCLVSLNNQLTVCGATLRVLAASARLRRLFDIVNLSGLLALQ